MYIHRYVRIFYFILKDYQIQLQMVDGQQSLQKQAGGLGSIASLLGHQDKLPEKISEVVD